MKVNAPEIIECREEITMVSNWAVYLCAKPENGTFKICHMLHEVLGEACDYEIYDDMGELIEELPAYIDGKGVFGINDGLVIGEDLMEDPESYETLLIELTDETAPIKVEMFLSSNGWHKSLLATIMERFEAARGN